jgi:predicted metal-binding membrane protein
MATTTRYPLLRERNAILVSLLALAAGAWALLVWQWATSDGDMSSLTMGMGAPLFIAIWVAMMVAMMFPTAAPMILTFARVQENRQRQERPFVPVWLFVSSYLLVWTVFGVLAYGAAVLLGGLADRSAWLSDNSARIGGGVLIAAGVYQLTPLKRACLSKCRTPMSFILTSWREGHWGSFRMGLEHGLYCLGCCWLLFVILFPLGMMNVAAMALITLLIFAEKSTPFGRQTATFASLGLIAYGAIVVFVPELLPTVMSTGGGSDGGMGSMS